MYDARVASVAGTELQRIDPPGMSGSGLRMLAVDHLDNRGRSIEEAEAIAAEVRRLVEGTWVDREGVVHPLTLHDILIVAPYNAQVRCLHSVLPDARVGTVDSSKAKRHRSSSSRWQPQLGRTSAAACVSCSAATPQRGGVARAGAHGGRVFAAAVERSLQQRGRHAAGQHAVPVRRRCHAGLRCRPMRVEPQTLMTSSSAS